MDLLHLDEAIDKLNKETVPKLEVILNVFTRDLNRMIERLDGVTITVVVNVPPDLKKENLR